MDVTFDKPYLEELYTTGKSDEKKHWYQPDIVRRYQRDINLIKQAQSIDDLMRINSLNYEVLDGDKCGVSAIRVNEKYRIEFTLETRPNTTVCHIVELSNHYHEILPCENKDK